MTTFSLFEFVSSVTDRPSAEVVATIARRSKEAGSPLLVRLHSWLKTGKLPGGLTDEERRAYRVLAASLVARREMKAEILNWL